MTGSLGGVGTPFPAGNLVNRRVGGKMDLANTLADLKSALDQKEREVQQLRVAIEALSGREVTAAVLSAGRRTDYQDLGVTAAAKRFLREMAPEPQTTGDIAQALLNRGLQTTSKKFVATVYATLNNGKMFKRTKDNRWQLIEEGEGK